MSYAGAEGGDEHAKHHAAGRQAARPHVATAAKGTPGKQAHARSPVASASHVSPTGKGRRSASASVEIGNDDWEDNTNAIRSSVLDRDMKPVIVGITPRLAKGFRASPCLCVCACAQQACALPRPAAPLHLGEGWGRGAVHACMSHVQSSGLPHKQATFAPRKARG